MKPFDLATPLSHLKNAGAQVAVACSGGLDSIALLHAACAAGLNPIALHINHGIAAESGAWAAHVAAQAAHYGAAFACIEATGLYSGMPSLEAAARSARHAALGELCAKHGVGTLLLAHHANDQAETVLLNLLRGTGLAGVGMPRERLVSNAFSSNILSNIPFNLSSVLWLRPWLDAPRSAIETYAAQHSLHWVEDPSNTDTTLRRNAVRHQLWPVVESVEPRALSSLTRFASIALDASQLALALAQTVLAAHTAPDGGLDWRSASKAQPESVQQALLRAFLATHRLRPPGAAQGAAMLAQLNALTGNGLRCSHGGGDLFFRDKRLYVRAQLLDTRG